MYKILIIEDEKLICEELSILLSNAGFLVDYIVDFKHTLQQIKIFAPDLILLDINLPGQDGYKLCSAIRSFSQTPILFTTGRNNAMDELQALTIGGDDYVTKPYNIPILLARINLLLKKRKIEDQSCLMEYKQIQLNLVSGTLSLKGKEIELTKTELKIMYYLFSHSEKIVSRLELVEYLWDNEIHIDDNTLSVNIMRIREKLYNIGVEAAKITSNDTVFDLYCGIGTISLFMAKYAKKVYGVEIVEQAIENAKENAILNNINNVDFIAGDTEVVIDDLINNKKIIPDVVMVDPPRKGLDNRSIDNILKIKPDRVVYISCNPATLVRDLAKFEEHYVIEEIRPVDMFPFTKHVECVAVIQFSF